jgi:hypothetical protein
LVRRFEKPFLREQEIKMRDLFRFFSVIVSIPQPFDDAT